MAVALTHGLLHHTLLRLLIEKGYPPTNAEVAAELHMTEAAVEQAMMALADYHGVVLHPNSTKLWVIHPFATAPTPFVVRTADREYWGNCAWCSFGVAALLNQDVTITTTLGADREQVELRIRDGKLLDTDYVVHFPVPMLNAWDNVIYTCTTMLVFKHEADVERWSAQHRIAKGDVQPVENVWEFSKVWYGNHLNPEWHKWTTAEAKAIFDRFGLTHDIWKMPVSDTRF